MKKLIRNESQETRRNEVAFFSFFSSFLLVSWDSHFFKKKLEGKPRNEKNKIKNRKERKEESFFHLRSEKNLKNQRKRN